MNIIKVENWPRQVCNIRENNDSLGSFYLGEVVHIYILTSFKFRVCAEEAASKVENMGVKGEDKEFSL